jgi:uncharacterized protein (TIGR03437 family)
VIVLIHPFSRLASRSAAQGEPRPAARIAPPNILLQHALVMLLVFCLSMVASAQISIVGPTNKTVDYQAGSSSFSVAVTGSNTQWTVEAIDSANTLAPTWITITTALPIFNSGPVSFTYTENDTPFPRTCRFRMTRPDTPGFEVFYQFVQDPPELLSTLTPSLIEIDGFGGTRDVAVVTNPQGAPWAATTPASWIQFIAGTGTGAGTLKLRILSNTTGSQRTADVTVLNSKVRVIQTSVEATFTLTPTSVNVPAAGTSGSVGVAVSAGTPAWTAVSNAAFITVTNGPNFTGNGTVNYTVAANASNDARQGTITIAGQTFTVNQAGADDEPPPPPADLTATPTSLTFVQNQGGSSTLTRTLNLGSTGDPLNFSIQINSGSGGNWLSTASTSGTTPQAIQFTANPAQLNTGTYTATVVITPTGGDPVNVPATLTINPPGDLSILPATPKSLFFSRVFGGAVPGVQRVRLSGPGVPIGANLSIQSNAWLNVALTSDATGTYILASIRNVNLSPGIYDSAITVESTGFQFKTFEIPVRYVVNLAGGSGPRISSGGITNGATFSAGGAPNTWISIFGTNLAASTQSWSPSTVNGALLPTTVGGTEVFVGGVRAAISYVSPAQVNALVPAIGDRGWVAVEVRSNGQPSEVGYLWVDDRNPAFFVYSPQGGKFPAAQHGNADPVGPVGLLPRSRPANALQTIAIYGTGFGNTNPASDPSRFFRGAAPLADLGKLRVTIGGLNAAVEFAGLVAPGLYQLNVALPALLPGEYPILVTLDDFTTQVGIVILVGQ